MFAPPRLSQIDPTSLKPRWLLNSQAARPRGRRPPAWDRRPASAGACAPSSARRSGDRVRWACARRAESPASARSRTRRSRSRPGLAVHDGSTARGAAARPRLRLGSGALVVYFVARGARARPLTRLCHFGRDSRLECASTTTGSCSGVSLFRHPTQLATLVGFEPTVSTLKGWRAGPLHHRVRGRKSEYRTSSTPWANCVSQESVRRRES